VLKQKPLDMKIFFIPLLSVVIFCCNSKESIISEDQNKFQKKLDHYKALIDKYDIATNKLTKSDYKNGFLDSLRSYLIDSSNYVLKNFNIAVDEVKIQDIKNVRAFYALFSDQNSNEYEMEFDYDRDSIQNLQTNPAYKLLKDIPVRSKAILSFFFLGEIEWNSDIMGAEVKLRVVPFPKDYNFDSSRAANKK
jgi:hypothetical protein